MNKDDLLLIDQFCVYHDIELTFMAAMQEHGLIEVIVIEEKQYFPLHELSTVEKIIRLFNDLEINLEGIDVILTLLDRIERLQNQLMIAQNKINFFETNKSINN